LPTHIVIVGAGLTGTALAARLLQRLERPATITLLDASGDFGPGLAYGTRHPSHVMNTPADRIGAVPGDRGHFVAWLERSGTAFAPGAFVPRALYGRYLRDVLDEAARRSDVGLARIADEAIGIQPTGDGFAVELASGRGLEADRVVLCTGYGLPPVATPSSRVVDDPWAQGWVAQVAPDEPVLFKGSGLTMVDQALRLRASGHRGALLAVSRRGLLPLGHGDPAPAPVPAMLAWIAPHSLADLLRSVRAAAASVADWRTAFDGLRPLNQAIWRSLSPSQKRRFDRHLRAYWNIHRHRMAPAVAAEIGALRNAGVLELRAGRIIRYAETIGGVCALVRARGAQAPETLRAAWLIDCSRTVRGPDGPLAWSLLALGLAERTAEGIGCRIDATGSFVTADGGRVEGLHGIGPIARAALGEITAIAEIREQCGTLAEELVRAAGTGTRRPAGGGLPLRDAPRF
jgi:uncharacterized NAD(P)/FAD-binding protein YdhS